MCCRPAGSSARTSSDLVARGSCRDRGARSPRRFSCEEVVPQRMTVTARLAPCGPSLRKAPSPSLDPVALPPTRPATYERRCLPPALRPGCGHGSHDRRDDPHRAPGSSTLAPVPGRRGDRFAADSPLEEAGFEPMVPQEKDWPYETIVIGLRPFWYGRKLTPSRPGPRVRILFASAVSH
jgi:hypothetical protein